MYLVTLPDTLLHPPSVRVGDVRLSGVPSIGPAFPPGWHPAYINSPFLQKPLMQGLVLTVLWQWVTIRQPWPPYDGWSHWKTDLWREQRLIQQWGSASDCIHSHVWLRIGWEELTSLPEGVMTEAYLCVCVGVGGWRTGSEEEPGDDVWGGSFVFTIHYLQGGITLDKGCFMPFRRRKINTSRLNKYCG